VERMLFALALVFALLAGGSALLFRTSAPVPALSESRATESSSPLAASAQPGTGSLAGPRLEISPCTTHDLGKGAVGDVLTGSLVFANSGDEDMTYRFELGCGCASVEPMTGKLPPRSTQKVRITLQLREEGKDERIGMRLVTNDPRQPGHQRFLHARCPSWLVLEPAVADLGCLRTGEVKEIVVAILDSEKRPLRSASTLTIGASVQDIVTTWCSDAVGANRFRVKVGPLPKGDFTGHVLLTGKDGAGKPKEHRLPVTARVQGPITVAPTSISFKRRSMPAEPRTLVLRFEDSASAADIVVNVSSDRIKVERPNAVKGAMMCFKVMPNKDAEARGGVEIDEIRFSLRGQPGQEERVQVFWRD
jgi:hypothetical protein